MSIFTSKEKINIDGKELVVISSSVEIKVNDADRLFLTVTGKQFPFGNVVREFAYHGEQWYVTSMRISETGSGPIEMRLEAINKKASGSYVPPRSLTPKPSERGMTDPHELCVPKEHYDDLKGLAAYLLQMHHDGNLELDVNDLERWAEWQIIHTEEDATMTGFIAVPPEVKVVV